ncbi:retrotransposon hot spot (RHS) protein [Trypanosoma rangeli]|uniref:Retrotransposon hot spot (RHS) protein n=1 Tax=Trypanosoma rangeli TaxID=5698 RepID=A0A422MTN1_TRYRA|nr:retrotransposon hot spot (RHS) protein [Trypanosoma rangeli]RNE96572.1 retrotransposon hot spot (RHS) protein [Trypanosoma rangeli]|eukprot:RNE96572.1 retrotransposon hot spot (RHS) protein [Trypanosoma rangeli]
MENFKMSRLLSALGTWSRSAADDLECLGCVAFLSSEGETRASVLADGHAVGRFPSRPYLLEYMAGEDNRKVIIQTELQAGVLYMPNKCFFPLMDAFCLVGLQPTEAAKKKIKFGRSRNAGAGGHSGAEREVTFIGLQVTKQNTHHTTAGKVAAFLKYMTCNFKGWEALREKMKW